MTHRLLVVEDDAAIAEPLVRALEREGWSVKHTESGEQALDALDAEAFALVVLDIGLPGMDGVEVCRRIRDGHPACGVLMLTARSSELDEVLGLDAGADDYVTKPFSLSVLLARVRALLRRESSAADGGGMVEAGPVRIDHGSHRAWCRGEELDLSPKQFDLLAYLVERPGVARRREEIMSAVWDENWWGSTKTLDVHIGWLRQKLGDPALISTVRGHGYRFELP
ncbi:MAG: response regulator transcription factor [Solirubrobacteraceae bacterium]|nr:response regulator transcription factor [Solirubrobacteraceae bacterium]